MSTLPVMFDGAEITDSPCRMCGWMLLRLPRFNSGEWFACRRCDAPPEK